MEALSDNYLGLGGDDEIGLRRRRNRGGGRILSRGGRGRKRRDGRRRSAGGCFGRGRGIFVSVDPSTLLEEFEQPGGLIYI
jgi:hypothetical protein